MSVYPVSENHIEYLVSQSQKAGYTSIYGPILQLGNLPQEVGQALWNENAACVKYKYSDNYLDLFSGISSSGQWPPVFKLQGHVYKLDHAQIVISCRCYRYQSNEHPEWDTSTARTFIYALERYFLDKIGGETNLVIQKKARPRIWGAPQPTNPESVSQESFESVLESASHVDVGFRGN